MDQTLKLKIKEYKKALDTLDKALREPSSDLIRDSVIKRFEYTYEICWKSLKRFLQDDYGVEAFSPKECFRELRKLKLIDEKTTELLLKMTDDRNEVIHTYNEKFSKHIYLKIKENYRDLLELVYKILV